jgi:hypothetical protein
MKTHIIKVKGCVNSDKYLLGFGEKEVEKVVELTIEELKELSNQCDEIIEED